MENWRFSNFYFFYFATVGIIMPYWGMYLDYLGFSGKEIGQLMAIFLATKMVAPNIWAWVADWLVARYGSAMRMVVFATLLTFLIYLL
ncbi:MAG: MFS transporter, partial [Gammaproteobacteria bacterium]|nr:MFS transporter [Gammaproteobacteria bacterium]